LPEEMDDFEDFSSSDESDDSDLDASFHGISPVTSDNEYYTSSAHICATYHSKTICSTLCKNSSA